MRTVKKFLFPVLCLLFLCKPAKNENFPLLSKYSSFEDFLYNEKFGVISEDASFKIEFFKEKNFKIEYGSEGWYWNASGSFETSENKVKLHPKECKVWTEEGKDCGKMFQEAQCSLKKQETNSSDYLLSCKFNKRFFIYSSFEEEDTMDFFVQ